jgi:hypothetical protein
MEKNIDSNNNEAINATVGSLVPDEIKHLFAECRITKWDTNAFTIASSPASIWLLLDGIHQGELNVIQNGPFSISVSVVKGVTFLLLDYGDGFIFKTMVSGMENKKKEDNSFVIFLVESVDLTIKAVRSIEINIDIMELLINAANGLKSVPEYKFLKITDKIANMYSLFDIKKRSSLSQSFARKSA